MSNISSSRVGDGKAIAQAVSNTRLLPENSREMLETGGIVWLADLGISPG
jgi:hypothetical protein